MLLSPGEATRFHAIYPALLKFAVEQAASEERKTDLLRRLNVRILEGAVEARDLLFSHPEILSDFARENPAQLEPRECSIVRSWLTHRKGRFIILRTLRHYAVFMSDAEPGVAYGVLGLFSRVDQMLGSIGLPALVETVLLPWEGRIIHDGFFQPYGVTFGPGLRQNMQEEFTRVKESQGFVTSFELKPRPAMEPATTNSVQVEGLSAEP